MPLSTATAVHALAAAHRHARRNRRSVHLRGRGGGRVFGDPPHCGHRPARIELCTAHSMGGR